MSEVGMVQAEAMALIERWIEGTGGPDASAWFGAELRAVRQAEGDRVLIRAVSLAPRRLGKADLVLTQDDRRAADLAVPGFDPVGLSIDQAARIAFAMAAYRSDRQFAEMLETLCRAADLQELVAYYRGLAIFPAGELLLGRAREGIRSAMRPLFEAVAHRNPYPRRMFDREGWNQMVLKALFIGSSLAPIQGLDERANPELAAMLVDYAHERWSAGRSVSPELWRCVGPFADADGLRDLRRLAAEGSQAERRAAALALSAHDSDEARSTLAAHQDLASWLASGRASWDAVEAG